MQIGTVDDGQGQGKESGNKNILKFILFNKFDQNNLT